MRAAFSEGKPKAAMGVRGHLLVAFVREKVKWKPMLSGVRQFEINLREKRCRSSWQKLRWLRACSLPAGKLLVNRWACHSFVRFGQDLRKDLALALEADLNPSEFGMGVVRAFAALSRGWHSFPRPEEGLVGQLSFPHEDLKDVLWTTSPRFVGTYIGHPEIWVCPASLVPERIRIAISQVA